MPNDATDIVARLRESDGGYFMRQMFAEAADEIERLQRHLKFAIQERDLARGEVCRLLAHSSKRDPDYWLNLAVAEYPTPQEVAESREWDLYRKDGTNAQ